ncbi:hypothetical protein F4820DRAFT_454486 [Hypoxylon rubiginosum]|uniref:Uncharacterized protein n=1 Tax=Hypoxylon rubiginosum TaxID=110542 RepID=A0ACB9YHH3_9PEZI|nr:hypothetical protein F4820DRAFT_454486 [Hypoxylon rubiginosum]
MSQLTTQRQSLPYDILEQVSSNIGPTLSDDETNKLFHTVVLRDETDRLHLLIALIRQPALGRYIKVLEIKDKLTFEDTEHLVATAYDEFIAAQPNIILPSKLRRCLSDGLKQGGRATILGLLIAYCPLLEQIDLVIRAYAEDFPWEVLQEVTEEHKAPEQSKIRLLSTGHLSRLQELRIAVPHGPKDQRMLKIFLALPNLTTLVCDLSYDNQQLRTTPEEIGLRSLTLSGPKMDSDALLDLFRLTPQLRFLQMRLSEFEECDNPTTLSQVGEALRRHDSGAYLETLVIEFDARLARCISRQDRIGSLQVLGNLKRLSIGLSELVGRMTLRNPDFNDDDMTSPLMINGELPHALQCLEIQYDLEAVTDIIKYFHDQVIDMISDPTRLNLRQVLLQSDTHGPTLLSYTRNIEDNGWTVTTYDSSLKLGTVEALEGCPMTAEGLLSIIHKEP